MAGVHQTLRHRQMAQGAERQDVVDGLKLLLKTIHERLHHLQQY